MTYIKKIKELSQIKNEVDFSNYIYDNFCSMELSIWKDNPSDWECYIRYDLPVNFTGFHIKSWLFQVWCYQDGFDYVGFTILGFTFAATRKYYASPMIKPKNNLLLSWLVTHFTIDINPIGGK